MHLPRIAITSKFVIPQDPSLPALALQLIKLESSYMIWVAVTDHPPQGNPQPALGNLAFDWACAMPPIQTGSPGAATALFRRSSSGIALSMAQRLARKFEKQVFVSADLPPSFMTMGQGPKLVLATEKGVIDALNEIEGNS